MKYTDGFRGIVFGLGGRVEGGYVGGYFHGETSHGGREFQWRGAGFSSIIWKKQWKNKYEKCFVLKVRSSIKT